MSWGKGTPQSSEKVEAFFDEFPFLGKVSKKAKTRWVQVSRVTLELVKSWGTFYVFDRQGLLVGETRENEALKDTLTRLAPESVGFIVMKESFSPAYGGLTWWQFLIGNYANAVTVYKPPKDFDLMAWLKAERAAIAEEVRREIAEVEA